MDMLSLLKRITISAVLVLLLALLADIIMVFSQPQATAEEKGLSPGIVRLAGQAKTEETTGAVAVYTVTVLVRQAQGISLAGAANGTHKAI